MNFFKLCMFGLVLSVRGDSSTGPEDFPDVSLNESQLEQTTFDFSTCGSAESYQSDYRGAISVTESGIPCQKWTDTTVHKHAFTPKKYPGMGLGDHNQCRNPDMSPAPWCFTVQKEKMWERCYVPTCEKHLNWEVIQEKREILKKEAQHVKAEFDGYFDDVRNLNSLCERFAVDYETETCEKDFFKRKVDLNIGIVVWGSGNKKDNARGFEDEVNASNFLGNEDSTRTNDEGNHENASKELKLESNDDDQKLLEWLPFTKNIRGSTAGNQNHKAERLASKTTHKINLKDMCRIYPTSYASTVDASFKKKIRVLVGDPDWKSSDFRNAQSAIREFNSCTQDMLTFKMKPYYFTKEEVNVEKKNWMTATYEVLQAADEKGIEVHGEKRYIDNKKKVFTSFNMENWITMVILPDDVDFEGAYGFAILHNGLVIIKSTEAKDSSKILHELGHSLGMRHSSLPNGTYGDDRCIMGDAKDKDVCFNGPKSVYLGLYREFTGIVHPLKQQCEVILIIADVQTHLSREENTFETWGRYYVIIQVPYDYKDSDKSLHLMYYGDDDNQFLAATEGSIETLVDTRSHRVSVASTSHRIFDLKVGETKIHKGILYKLCKTNDKKIAKVIMTHNVKAALTCATS